MEKSPRANPRRQRVDALRNRERVLEAAAAVFSAGGPGASLEAVARDAGVGIGTVYRHFPTRATLFEAVYRREVQHLSELAETLNTAGDAIKALQSWLHAIVEFAATKKGMATAFVLAADNSSELHAQTSEHLAKAAKTLLDTAMQAGEIRRDVSPQDLLRAIAGMCYLNDQPGWQASVRRLIDIFVDGLRKM